MKKRRFGENVNKNGRPFAGKNVNKNSVFHRGNENTLTSLHLEQGELIDLHIIRELLIVVDGNAEREISLEDFDWGGNEGAGT